MSEENQARKQVAAHTGVHPRTLLRHLRDGPGEPARLA
jgi:hypothetical protein